MTWMRWIFTFIYLQDLPRINEKPHITRWKSHDGSPFQLGLGRYPYCMLEVRGTSAGGVFWSHNSEHLRLKNQHLTHLRLQMPNAFILRTMHTWTLIRSLFKGAIMSKQDEASGCCNNEEISKSQGAAFESSLCSS